MRSETFLQQVKVKADVVFPNGDYRVTDSRTPGFPIIVNVDGADTIQLKATKGSFIHWTAPDYYVDDMGAEQVLRKISGR
ncbi:hypothetical protein [Paenibacillus sp. HW567]|uniref:hypothetical protein n=1 Tax=Paenibacillus sp. HW567 TaxID=1034769 RepID=UPI00036ACB46|nr:hypothetical protein [Paenibacillus sp. HW567]